MAARRLAEEAQRAEAAKRFAKKLERMDEEERAEMRAIRSCWEEIADQLGLREPLSREDQLSVLRKAPVETLRRYREIRDRYPD
jgi:hypothetical protein